MSPRVWLLLAMVLTGAVWLVLHAVCVWQAIREKDIPIGWRLFAWLPPLAPALTWRAGRRVAPTLWLATGLLYLIWYLV